MPSAAKKSAARKSSAVRDITAKRVKRMDAFSVKRLDDDADDSASVEPLIEHHHLENDPVENLEDEVEQVLADVDDIEKSVPMREDSADVEPRDFVKVKFTKFVQLVTSRDCSDVVEANPNEEVVMSSNLLTELAGAHDEREEKKIPLVFLVGLAIGVVLTYILIMK
jgi:hypothetical protein